MQRLTSLRLPALRRLAPPRTLASIPTQHHHPRNASTSSAPESAQDASAESGGSRSKSVEEKAGGRASGGSVQQPGAMPDSLSERKALGRTGGGQPLDSSNHPPPQPKVSNHRVPGTRPGHPDMTEEQKREVEEHNREFEAKHDRAAPAAEDKVDKSFWGGRDAGSKD